MNLFLLFGPVGIILGYIMAAWFVTHFNWKYAIYAQILISFPVFFSLLFVSIKYIDLDLALQLLRL